MHQLSNRSIIAYKTQNNLTIISKKKSLNLRASKQDLHNYIGSGLHCASKKMFNHKQMNAFKFTFSHS